MLSWHRSLVTHRVWSRNQVGQAILPAAAFQAAFRTWTSQQFQTKGGVFGLVCFKSPAAKPEKFVRRRGSRLKAGCSQDWLPHERAKAEQTAFQAAVQQTTHAVRTYSSGFVFAGIPQRSLGNSSRIGNGGLKGRLQARLPAARMAKVQGRASIAYDRTS